MKMFLILLIFLPVVISADNGPVSLQELSLTTDQEILEAEIARIETTGETIEETERLKRLGIAWHNLSSLEISGASKQADKWLKKAFDAAPADHEIMVYYGSARTMVARDSWNPLTKMRTANKGIALIDRAIRQAPDNVIVRLIRASNSLALPEMFERHPKAREDFGFLHGRLDTLDISSKTKAEICFKLGEILAEDGDRTGARALYEQTQTLSPGSTWAQRAAERL